MTKYGPLINKINLILEKGKKLVLKRKKFNNYLRNDDKLEYETL